MINFYREIKIYMKKKLNKKKIRIKIIRISISDFFK